MRKVLVLYHSVYGNTKKVALSLSRGLEAGGFHVDCISIEDYSEVNFDEYEIIGIGGPTHFCGPSKKMRFFLKYFSKLNLWNKKAFAFETKADFR